MIEKEMKAARVQINEKILRTPSSVFIANNNSADLKFIGAGQKAKEINKQWLERIMQDAYVDEAFLVLMDFIKSN